MIILKNLKACKINIKKNQKRYLIQKNKKNNAIHMNVKKKENFKMELKQET